MKKIYYALALLLFFNTHFANEGLWNQFTYYTVINTTQEIMEVSWQSGGGIKNTLTGKGGSFTLPALGKQKMATNNDDCLDTIVVKALTTAQTASLSSVCHTTIKIRYTGDIKKQKLILETI